MERLLFFAFTAKIPGPGKTKSAKAISMTVIPTIVIMTLLACLITAFIYYIL